jgi:hypothetical protein
MLITGEISQDNKTSFNTYFIYYKVGKEVSTTEVKRFPRPFGITKELDIP